MSYQYDNAGRVTNRTLENNTFTVLAYDAADQVTNIWHRQISGGVTNTLSQYQYGYDGAGNRTWVKRASGRGDVYKYDAIDQLTNVLYEASNPDTTPTLWTNQANYVFDAAGNRTSVVVTNTGTTSYTANSLNQYSVVGGTNCLYDKNGNLTNDGTWGFTFDPENRLTKAVKGGTTVKYTYDVFGRLIQRVNSSTTNRYYYDGWQLIEERDGGDNLVAEYVNGPNIDDPGRMIRNGKYYYYTGDAQGNITEITDTNGAVVEKYSYDVYGTPTIRNGSGTVITASAIGNRLMFQGRDRDPDTGLYNFRNRNYSSTLGRFVQTDPIRLIEVLSNGGDADYDVPQNDFSTNTEVFLQEGEIIVGVSLYRFVLNNPVNLTDVYGLGFWNFVKKLFPPYHLPPPFPPQCTISPGTPPWMGPPGKGGPPGFTINYPLK